ncbi:MAG: response regulator [Flavobacterium circumlabens]|uniref:Response regulator n=1 Tax=Flavobacterium circumlabens TaxID=2133765 RepID=A0A4Y7UGJ0_9FLAO|nr:response regulator [Flavobacterium circumlabens]TCN60069.1 response regulator receiver domain-containing protein [Flavobacterium circumlabens]TEB45301.1 response regulator [Flavobacterium circumlabens]
MLYKNILLIDDDRDDTDIFIEAINSLNKDIRCVAENNPIKALENLKSSEKLPDLIFLDYNMPVINGCEFLQKMRKVQQLQQIPVILYSTYSEAAAEQLSITQDTEKYITKPNTFVELKAVLKDILGA